MALQLAIAPPLLFLLARRAGGYPSLRAEPWLQRLADARTVSKFHGHLGPWAALGLKMGRHALQILGHKGYFGLTTTVEITPEPPSSCLVDGLQLSTGCSYGKRNIEIVPSDSVRVRIKEEGKPVALVITLTSAAEALTAGINKENQQERFFAVLRASPADLFVIERTDAQTQ